MTPPDKADKPLMPDEVLIARQGIEFICPAWSKDPCAVRYIRADLAQPPACESVTVEELDAMLSSHDGDRRAYEIFNLLDALGLKLSKAEGGE